MNKKMTDELGEIINDYKMMPSFVSEYNNITPIEFDYYTVNKLSLFVVHENFDFDNVNNILDKLDFTLPSVKRIFAKPIIHLKEDDEVLPVEAVKLVNNRTIDHISTHSELWDDFDDNGIKPLKLLTRTYKDNYSIYENIVFVKTVDCMLGYLRKNMRQLENLMYTTRNLEFNLLERVNHIDYFLAIGKLHTGYIRNFSRYYDQAKVIYERMNVMYETLQARLKRNVYRLNRNYKGNFQLHNSNILHMQKDYHRVYTLLKYFHKTNMDVMKITKEETEEFYSNYLLYLKVIVIFAVMHFNFEPIDGTIIDYNNLNVDFTFKGWKLSINTALDEKAVVLTIKSNKTYMIALAPFCYIENNEYDMFDELICTTPYSEDKKNLYISISDIESFRRIQQIILRGMVYSDSKHNDCPFCGNKFKKESINDYKTNVCESCHTLLRENTCLSTGEKYYYTNIYGFRISDHPVKEASERLHYRNITDITLDGEIICPKCKKVHKNK